MAANSTTGLLLSRLTGPLVLCLALPGAASAADITVGGACDLVEAIQNANDTTDGQPNADCAAGDPAGADTIVLTADVALTSAFAGADGLPPIASEIAVEGNGHTIEGLGVFRILTVSSGGDLTLQDTTVEGGKVFGTNGGGIHNSGALTLIRSTLQDNEAESVCPSTSVYGGGLYNASGATANLLESAVVYNRVRSVLCSTGPVNETDSASGPSPAALPFPVPGFGGGIRNVGTATLRNTTVFFNSCYSDPGNLPCGTPDIDSSGGTLTLLQSTVRHFYFSSGSAEATNSILVFCNDTAPTDGGGNSTTDTSCGMGTVAELGLGNFGDNGGPTLTMALDADSDAIDAAGDCALLDPALASDQRGAPRFDGACDGGAFEFGGCPILELADDTVTGAENHEECDIHVGPNYAVAGPAGDLTLTAGSSVTVFDGFEVGTDASAVFGIDPSLQITSAIEAARAAGWMPPEH